MAERTQLSVKKPEAKRENKTSQTQKTGPSQSISSPVEQILFLQRAIGNQAVGRLIKSGALQAKLRIGQPGDIYEQEADRVAEQVMRMPEPKVSNETKVSNPAGNNSIQRKCPGCKKGTKIEKEEEEEKVQKKEACGSTPEVTPELESSISAVRGGGQPLPDSVRSFMEPRFNTEFSSVRIHTDSNAHDLARSVNANAFTVEGDIVLGAGQYAPGTGSGKHLIAHELTHVVQQQGLRSHARGMRLQRQVPKEITAQVGPVSGEGGLIYDSSRKRMSIIIGPNDTLLTVAQRLLLIWNSARPFVPAGTTTPRPVTQLTVEQLAKGLLVYNRYYLAVPSMTEWKVGLRFPLPIEVNQVTGERTLNPDLIATWAGSFDPAWVPLLGIPPAATVAPMQAGLHQSVQTFLQQMQTLTARSIHLSARAMRNAREAEPFIQEVFRQAASGAFDLALAFMDQIVIHQFDILASQRAGQGIIDTIRNILANVPSSPSSSQQQSLDRANRLFNRLGVFSAVTAERVRNIYATKVPGCHCMAAVYHGLEGLFSEGVSQSIESQVGRESREVMRRTGRNTNHMDRIMETVRVRGMAGPETQLVYQAASNTWQPDPEVTVLGMTHPSVAGWYFFGLSLHAAYHSVILAVDKTDPASPRIYWMDQFSPGFTNDVTGTLMDKMRSIRPGYGFSPSRLWQIMPAADTSIILD